MFLKDVERDGESFERKGTSVRREKPGSSDMFAERFLNASMIQPVRTR